MYLYRILFVYTSSAVNLFIYGLTNRQFRKVYIDLQQVTCPSSLQFTPGAT